MRLREALRNLARHRWRTRLTVGGVALAMGLIVWSTGLMDAFLGSMVDATTREGIGDLQISTAAWARTPALTSTFAADDAWMERLRALPQVAGATRRIEAAGLVGAGGRSAVALLFGVEPQKERRVSDLAERVADGRWLDPSAPPSWPLQAVLGEGFARRLGVRPGDALAVVLQAADGSLGNDRLRVVGIVHTDSADLDRQGVILSLGDAAGLAALGGRTHQVLVRLRRGADLDEAARSIGALTAGWAGSHGSPVRVRTWREAVPELARMVDLSDVTMWVVYAIVFFVAALGVLNAQRMSALERRREFGVLMALGTTPAGLAGLLLTESVLMTALGVGAGFLLGGGLTLYHSIAGFDLTGIAGGSGGFSFMGASYGGRIFLTLSASRVLPPVGIFLLVGGLAGVWPAVQAARLDPGRAIAGRA